MAPVAVRIDCFGPCHVARIAAAASVLPTIGSEFGAESWVYVSRKIDDQGLLLRYTIGPHGTAERMQVSVLAKSLFALLNRTRPSVIALPGGSHREALLAPMWDLRTKTPTIQTSNRQEYDARRTWWKELSISRLVSCCLQFVGGQRQSDTRQLGMPANTAFRGCAAMVNEHLPDLLRGMQHIGTSKAGCHLSRPVR